MLGMDAVASSARSIAVSRVGPDDLALPGVDAARMFQCAEHQIECLDRLLSLRVRPSIRDSRR